MCVRSTGNKGVRMPAGEEVLASQGLHCPTQLVEWPAMSRCPGSDRQATMTPHCLRSRRPLRLVHPVINCT